MNNKIIFTPGRFQSHQKKPLERILKACPADIVDKNGELPTIEAIPKERLKYYLVPFSWPVEVIIEEGAEDVRWYDYGKPDEEGVIGHLLYHRKYESDNVKEFFFFIASTKSN